MTEMNASRFTLLELLALVTCSAVSFFFSTTGGLGLGACFFITVVAFRTSIVDFPLLGGLATLLTMLFGLLTLGFMVIWAINW